MVLLAFGEVVACFVRSLGKRIAGFVLGLQERVAVVVLWLAACVGYGHSVRQEPQEPAPSFLSVCVFCFFVHFSTRASI